MSKQISVKLSESDWNAVLQCISFRENNLRQQYANGNADSLKGLSDTIKTQVYTYP